MIENMEWYGWAGLMAFACKIYLTAVSRNYIWADKTWYFLVAMFSTQNLAEFLGYVFYAKTISPMLMVNLYYAASIFSLVAIFCLIVNNFRARILLIVSATIIVALISFTGVFIDGYVASGYPGKVIKGDFYWVVQIFMVACVFAIVSQLARGYRSSKHAFQIDSIYHMVAFTPFLMIVLIHGSFGLFGYSVNASGWFPIATTLFMWVTIKTRCTSDYERIDPRGLIPFTREWNLYRSVGHTIFLCVVGRYTFDRTLNEAGKHLLVYKELKHAGSKSALADDLGLNRHQLARRLQKHGVTLDN